MGCSSSAPHDVPPGDLPSLSSSSLSVDSGPSDDKESGVEEESDSSCISHEEGKADSLYRENEVKLNDCEQDDHNLRADDYEVSPPQTAVVNQCVYEYQRLHPNRGWGNTSPGHLLPSDKGKFSNCAGSVHSRDSILDVVDPVVRSWEVLTTGEENSQAWQYGFDFDECEWKDYPDANSYVRRRRRVIQFLNPIPPSTCSTSAQSVPVPLPVLPSVVTPPPPMRGWLSKEGGAFLRSYSDRYFVLHSSPGSSTLRYYLKEVLPADEEPQSRGGIDLRGATFTRGVMKSCIASAYCRKKFLLDLRASPLCEEWVTALLAHIEYANKSQVGAVVAVPVTPAEKDISVGLTVTPPSTPTSHAGSVEQNFESPSLMSDTIFINEHSAHQYLYVYERWQPLIEWGNSYPGHMLPTDKGKYSSRSCTTFSWDLTRVIPPLPEHWLPQTEFMTIEESDDEEPWEYSVTLMNSQWHSMKQPNSCVRRKLLRRLVGDCPPSTNSVVQLSPSTVTTAKLPPPMMRGWISKEGGAVRRSFNNRYFVLMSTVASSTLTYFLRRVPEERPPYGMVKRGELDLRGGTFTQGTSHSTVIGRDGKKKKKYVLDLKSSAERDEWVHALQRHVQYANYQQAVCNRVRAAGGGGEDAMFSFADVGV